MEHIKQQIEALREQADKLAQVLGGKRADITVKLINDDGWSSVGTEVFTEQEEGAIDELIAESGLFSEKSKVHYHGSQFSVMYHLKNNHASYVMFHVKESRDTEIDRLRRRLAELEGGER